MFYYFIFHLKCTQANLGTNIIIPRIPLNAFQIIVFPCLLAIMKIGQMVRSINQLFNVISPLSPSTQMWKQLLLYYVIFIIDIQNCHSCFKLQTGHRHHNSVLIGQHLFQAHQRKKDTTPLKPTCLGFGIIYIFLHLKICNADWTCTSQVKRQSMNYVLGYHKVLWGIYSLQKWLVKALGVCF